MPIVVRVCVRKDLSTGGVLCDEHTRLGEVDSRFEDMEVCFPANEYEVA